MQCGVRTAAALLLSYEYVCAAVAGSGQRVMCGVVSVVGGVVCGVWCVGSKQLRRCGEKAPDRLKLP